MIEALAWVLAIIGIPLLIYPVVVERLYGKFRPTAREVWDMSGEEYDRHLPDPRFQRYINHTHRFPWLRRWLG